MEGDGLIAIELSSDERRVLVQGLVQWFGPSKCTDALALAMDFESAEDMSQQSKRLIAELSSNEPLSAKDWRRTLVATEIVFSSDVFGAGVEWSICTGIQDGETAQILRGLQRKVARALPRGTYRFR
ncbi:hypothetical protein KO481_39825 [Nocardia sp. NEAU-G5]|uniref:Uncharacterized protein n=1 Tax=Nocardia albiluteola TaxID=2842303 RepID=A0ABS6BBJ3_9NOCA|nr:hypothetical protein [Nocardia albiluteola]MBU3067656.1 hypothetical protein [Nocardia albiluteola]